MRKLQVSVSVVCLILILLHMILPRYKVDSITIALVVIAFLPWIAPFVESFKAPGGWEIRLRQLEKLEDKAREVGLLDDELTTDNQQYSFLSISTKDPNLALVGLRIEIERRLRDIAKLYQIEVSRMPVGVLLRELRKKHVLSQNEQSVLADMVGLLNRAAHAADVDSRAAEWALATGPKLLSSLDSRLERSLEN